MKRTKIGQALGYAEVAPPAAKIQVETGDDLPHAQSTATAGQFPHPLFEPVYRFGVDADARIAATAGKTEPEKAHPPLMSDTAFLLIHL